MGEARLTVCGCSFLCWASGWVWAVLVAFNPLEWILHGVRGLCWNQVERRGSSSVSRASGTEFTHKAVPGLKSVAKFRASLRDEEPGTVFTGLMTAVGFGRGWAGSDGLGWA